MKLISEEIESKLPKLHETEHIAIAEKIVIVKFFTPDADWTWYAIEYDPEEKLFFGFVEGISSEWGYFSLEELESAKGPLGLPIERDLFWKPKKFSEIRLAERVLS